MLTFPKYDEKLYSPKAFTIDSIIHYLNAIKFNNTLSSEYLNVLEQPVSPTEVCTMIQCLKNNKNLDVTAYFPNSIKEIKHLLVELSLITSYHHLLSADTQILVIEL